MFGDRLNQVDLRLARIFKLRNNQYRLQLMVDVYNALNKSPVIAYNTTFCHPASTSPVAHPS